MSRIGNKNAINSSVQDHLSKTSTKQIGDADACRNPIDQDGRDARTPEGAGGPLGCIFVVELGSRSGGRGRLVAGHAGWPWSTGGQQGCSLTVQPAGVRSSHGNYFSAL